MKNNSEYKLCLGCGNHFRPQMFTQKFHTKQCSRQYERVWKMWRQRPISEIRRQIHILNGILENKYGGNEQIADMTGVNIVHINPKKREI